ncbi:MAG: hypothetical protein Q8P07_04550 [bacterium]|nr:hypothetical protein [bacterium]
MYIKEYDGRKYFFYTSADFETDFPLLIKRIRELEKTRMPGFTGVKGINRGGDQIALWLSHALNVETVSGGVTKNTIVADDIADTGSTLLTYKNRDVIIVTLFYHRQSLIVPHIWLHEKTPDIHEVIYPWERYSPRILTMFPLPSP